MKREDWIKSTLNGFSKSIGQSNFLEQGRFRLNLPIVAFQLSLIIDPLRISHITYHELDRWSLKKDFHRHCELLISLGCSGITTRIMRRTLKILFVFTVCEQQMNKYSVLVRFCGWSRGSRLDCAFWSAPGDRGGVSWLGINIARNERSIHYAGFPVRMKQALLRELEWLGSVVQCVTGSMTTSLQYRVNIVTTSSTCVEPGFCS